MKITKTEKAEEGKLYLVLWQDLIFVSKCRKRKGRDYPNRENRCWFADVFGGFLIWAEQAEEIHLIEE